MMNVSKPDHDAQPIASIEGDAGTDPRWETAEPSDFEEADFNIPRD